MPLGRTMAHRGWPIRTLAERCAGADEIRGSICTNIGPPPWQKAADFIDLAADLAATIQGIPKEDLLSQEVRQQRRALMLAWSAVASLLVLAVAAGWQWQIARTQRAKAENALTTAAGTADRLVYDLALDLRNRRGMPVELVLNILDRAVEMQSQLANAQDTTPELRRLEATAMGELATTLIDQGARTSAKSAAERALDDHRKSGEA